MKKAFITGITGFAGSFLAENLINRGSYEVSGTYLSENSLDNLSSVKDKVNLHRVDLQNPEEVKKIIQEENPDVIFHLAALAATGESYNNPSKFITNNISAQISVLEAVRSIGISPKTLIVSSAEVYGDVEPSDLPIDEDTPLKPVNPYAISKIACDFMGFQYFISQKIPIIRVRPFNHIGPRQAPTFAVPSFAKRIAEIEAGISEPILKVGNLEPKRDFTDVRDMVDAYVELIEKGEVGDVYNAGSGHSIKIEDILGKLLALTKTQIKIERDESLFRPIDMPDLVCDNTKIRQTTGWEPKINIDDTLAQTLEYFRGHKI